MGGWWRGFSIWANHIHSLSHFCRPPLWYSSLYFPLSLLSKCEQVSGKFVTSRFFCLGSFKQFCGGNERIIRSGNGVGRGAGRGVNTVPSRRSGGALVITCDFYFVCHFFSVCFFVPTSELIKLTFFISLHFQIRSSFRSAFGRKKKASGTTTDVEDLDNSMTFVNDSLLDATPPPSQMKQSASTSA